jgi:hypothetical protein
MINKAKKKVHAFNFQGEGCHVALVDKAANLQAVLTMKASEQEVVITTSMRNFLVKFFDMWSDDAAILAAVLGYSDGSSDDYPETYEDYIKEKIDSVQLLKGLDLNIKSLPKSVALKVEELQKEFGDKITSEGLPLGANNLEGDNTLSEVKIDAKELDVLKAAAAKTQELTALSEQVEILKAQAAESAVLKEQIEILKSEKATKIKQEMTDVVKGYTFIDDASKESIVDFLIKSEGSSIVLETLEKAREAIAAAVGINSESGNTGEGDLLETVDASKSKNEQVINSVQKILANRKS